MNFKKLSAVCLSAMFVAPFYSAGMNEKSELVEPFYSAGMNEKSELVEPCSSVEKKENSESNKNAELCVICQGNLKNVENLSPGTFYSNREEYKTECGHVVHGNCLLQWIRTDDNKKFTKSAKYLRNNYSLENLHNFEVGETCCPMCRQSLQMNNHDLKNHLSENYEVVDVTEYYKETDPHKIAEKIFQEFGHTQLSPTGLWYKKVGCHKVETDIGPRYLVVNNDNLSTAIENELCELFLESLNMNKRTCCKKIARCVGKMFWPVIIGGVVCWVVSEVIC